MSPLTPWAFNNANNSSKSFETLTCDLPSLPAHLFQGFHPLPPRHLRPEFAVGFFFFLEGTAFAEPDVLHGVILPRGVHLSHPASQGASAGFRGCSPAVS